MNEFEVFADVGFRKLAVDAESGVVDQNFILSRFRTNCCYERFDGFRP